NSGQQGGFIPGQSGQQGQTGLLGKIDEADASTILTQAQSLFVNNDLDRANEKLLGLLTSSPSFWQDCPTVAPSAALLRTKALFKLKKYPEAQTQCSMLVKQAPNSQESAEANFFLGYCYDFYAQQDQAIDCFRKVVTSKYETDFTDDANYYLGMNEWERKNPVVAEDAFKKIYRSYKSSDYWGHAVWALAQIEFEAHNYEEAERLVNEALGDKPDHAIADRLLFLKGEIALKFRDYDKARMAFDMLITQYPNSSKVTVARNRLATLPGKTEADAL
ncbi:MAG: tetratricopeptide repeat protein, partial [Thermoguttaceae bacterium]|nr:tetratricopeptide repeat protein [Thermoguttaceae bacterium]